MWFRSSPTIAKLCNRWNRRIQTSLVTLSRRSVSRAVNKPTKALLFPSQASQYVGMTKDLCETYPFVNELFKEMDSFMQYPLSQLMHSGSHIELRETMDAQPAVFCHSVAILKILTTLHPTFFTRNNFVCLGHSLGEYSALYAAGAFGDIESDGQSWKRALNVVKVRAQSMQRCCDDGIVHSLQSMFAILRSDEATIRKSIDDVLSQSQYKDYICDISNFNSPYQIVISGHLEACIAVISHISAHQKKRCKAVRLHTSGAFHTLLMGNTVDPLKQSLKQTKLSPLQSDVVFNVNSFKGKPRESDIKQWLCKQVICPVLWTESVKQCLDDGIREFIEIGPKTVLSSFVKETADYHSIDDVSVSNIETVTDINLLTVHI